MITATRSVKERTTAGTIKTKLDTGAWDGLGVEGVTQSEDLSK